MNDQVPPLFVPMGSPPGMRDESSTEGDPDGTRSPAIPLQPDPYIFEQPLAVPSQSFESSHAAMSRGPLPITVDMPPQSYRWNFRVDEVDASAARPDASDPFEPLVHPDPSHGNAGPSVAPETVAPQSPSRSALLVAVSVLSIVVVAESATIAWLILGR